MKFAAGEKDSLTGRPYCYESECGRYTVTIPHNGEDVYLAFKRPEEKTRPALLLGGFASSKLARAACETDQSNPRT